MKYRVKPECFDKIFGKVADPESAKNRIFSFDEIQFLSIGWGKDVNEVLESFDPCGKCKTIECLFDFCFNFGSEIEHIEHDIYKYTECGAWIDLDYKDGIHVGSIVEGSDAEFDFTLNYPFPYSAFETALEALEHEVDVAWKEANGVDEDE